MHNNRLYEQARFYLQKSEELQEELSVADEVIDNLVEFIVGVFDDAGVDPKQAETLLLEMAAKAKAPAKAKGKVAAAKAKAATKKAAAKGKGMPPKAPEPKKDDEKSGGDSGIKIKNVNVAKTGSVSQSTGSVKTGDVMGGDTKVQTGNVNVKQEQSQAQKGK